MDVNSVKIGNDSPAQFYEEGLVKICVDADAQTFYNPVQEFNRDLTVLVLRQYVSDRKILKTGNGCKPSAKRAKSSLPQFSEKISILDALSASGLRALRFSKEVPDVDFVLANDFSHDAVEMIRHNAKLNGLESIIKPSYGDAIDVMMSHRTFDKRFHAVDLDPYGSAAYFLDSAVQCVADEGILMVTCTDTATLCGNTPEACFNKYGSVPLRHRSCHEFALRILLRCIDSHANRHGRYIKPLLSVSVDFYVRVFVQLFTSASLAKDSVTKLANVVACTSCRSLEFQPLIRKTISGTSVRFTNSLIQSLIVSQSTNSKASNDVIIDSKEPLINSHSMPKLNCSYCNVGPLHLAGPIYIEKIHDSDFVNRLLTRLNQIPTNERLGTHNRLYGLLSVVSEEVHEIPLFYESDHLMNITRCSIPKHIVVRSAIFNAGYKCSISHSNPKALKTNAPVSFLWDVCRAWAKKNKIDAEKLKNFPVAYNILSKTIQTEINFSLNPLAMPKSKTDCLLRFPDNKGKNWGPKSKAKGSITSATAGFMTKM